MPAWLISLLLNLFIKFGWPWILDWLKKHFPNVLPEAVHPILSDFRTDIEEAKISRRQAKRRARVRLQEALKKPNPEN